jgi:hypothetical protein
MTSQSLPGTSFAANSGIPLRGDDPTRASFDFMRKSAMSRWPWRRHAVMASLVLGGCAIFGGCGSSSSSNSAPVNWAEVEAKTDPKLLMKKNAKGKMVEAVEREDRRRALLETKRKLEEGQ